jgi:uncharacterized protein YggE
MANPESDASTPTVTVRGAGLIRAEPDEAVLSITLNALKERPGAALADVSARASKLVALLDEAGVKKADRSTTGVTVVEEFDHTEEGRRSLGHRASSGVSVRLTDPDVIGKLVANATEDLAAQINGPRWVISLDNPVRLEAARKAAADARRRAEAYARGVGAKLGGLIGMSEFGPPDTLRLMPAALSAGHHPMPIEPGEHDVTAAVWATFALDLA